MREFEYTFDDGLSVGLRHHHKNPRGSQALVSCKNWRATPVGLSEWLEPELAYNSRSVSPFPQLFIGQVAVVLIDRSLVSGQDRIYEWSNGGFQLKAAIAFGTYGQGGRYSFADFGPYAVLTNGKSLSIRGADTGNWTVSSALGTIPLMKTVLSFRGQLVGGGIYSSWHGCNNASIVWSKIGSIDCTPDRANTAGFRPMPQGGTVHQVLELGKKVIAYGSRGICELIPVTNPVPTFGLETLLGQGIVSEGAVAGDDTRHIFIDKLGWLWELNKGMELKKLGYQEFMTQLDPVSLSITYDKLEDEFHITDGEKGFLLTRSGLSEIGMAVTGIGEVDGGHAFVGQRLSLDELEFTIDTLDFGMRGNKTVMLTEFGVTGGNGGMMQMGWRSDSMVPLSWTRPVPVNKEGVGTQIISGTDFQLRYAATRGLNTQIDYLKLRWKMTDLRSLRGVYAAPLRGQS